MTNILNILMNVYNKQMIQIKLTLNQRMIKENKFKN